MIPASCFSSPSWPGVIAAAVSGAMLAMERNLDLFGVIFLGVVTAIGGGVIRDLLLGQIPPWPSSTIFTLLPRQPPRYWPFAWAPGSIPAGRPLPAIPFVNEAALNFFDAAGLGIFSAIGVQNTIRAGFGG